MRPQINIIIPLFNEELIFSDLVSRLNDVMDTVVDDIIVSVILIDDGSKDSTAALIKQKAQTDHRYVGVLLSRNFGHQLALSAGLAYADATEAIMVMDGDLQDPPELLKDFYTKYKEGYDVVYAVRKKRKEVFYKKWAYSLFYKLLKKVSNIDIPLDSGDFSLMSRKVVDHLVSMPEESRFIRGMRSWVGYKQIGIEYDRSAREIGESKYSFAALLKLALNGIFNFSEYPIKFISNLGLITTLISGLYLAYILFEKLFLGTAPKGFAALVFLICLFGGVQLLAIGIIGEYIVRIFFQVKGRPNFIVKEFVKKIE
jgi:polyisoprenyl-phosphate glycosyltransferase